MGSQHSSQDRGEEVGLPSGDWMISTIGVHVNGGCCENRMKTKLEVETQKPWFETFRTSWPSAWMDQLDSVAGLVELNWKEMYGWLKSARTKNPPDSRNPSASK